MKLGPPLVYGKTSYSLLTAASTAPQTREELLDRLAKRGIYLEVGSYALNDQLGRLAYYGVLSKSGPGCAHHPYRYALTPAGEAELDRMWGKL